MEPSSDLQPVLHPERLDDFKANDLANTRVIIRESISAARSNERSALVASAAVWAWLLTHPNVASAIASIIPLAITILAGARTFSLLLDVRRATAYAREMEAQLGPPNGGWDDLPPENWSS